MTEPLMPEVHIRSLPSGLYERAYAFAEMVARQDTRLVGLDRIRTAITREAALRATGFPPRPLKLPRSAGPATGNMQTIAEEVLEKATIAAKEKLRG